MNPTILKNFDAVIAVLEQFCSESDSAAAPEFDENQMKFVKNVISFFKSQNLESGYQSVWNKLLEVSFYF